MGDVTYTVYVCMLRVELQLFLAEAAHTEDLSTISEEPNVVSAHSIASQQIHISQDICNINPCGQQLKKL